MGTPYDPDIQDAPVYPVMFEIQQDSETVQMIDSQKPFTVRCSVYVPTAIKEEMKERNHFIYATLLNNDMPIEQKIGKVDLDSNQKSSILQFAIVFELDDGIKDKTINLQIAITPKHEYEMGIGESIRVGRFVNTYIPLENRNE